MAHRTKLWCLRCLQLIREIEKLDGVVLHKDGTLRVLALAVLHTSLRDILERLLLPHACSTHTHVEEAQHDWKHEKMKAILASLLCMYEKSRKVYFCFTGSVL